MQENNIFMKSILDNFDRPSTANITTKRKQVRTHRNLNRQSDLNLNPKEGWLTVEKMDSCTNVSKRTFSASRRKQEATTQATLIADSFNVKSLIDSACSNMNEAHRSRVLKC